jgi:hypothetical protein
MNINELIKKVIEKMLADGLIEQKTVDATKTKKSEDGKEEFDLAKFAASIGNDVFEKFKTYLEDEKKAEAEVQKRIAEAKKIEEDVAKAAKVEENAGKEVSAKVQGAPAIIGKFKNVSDSDMEVIEAIKTARGGQKVTLEDDINIAKGDNVISENKAKALDAAVGYGIEWVPEERGTDLYVRLNQVGNAIHQRFRKRPMSSRTQKLNELLTHTTVKGYSGNQTADKAIENVTESSITTGDATLTAKSIVAKSYVYNDVAEDAIIDLRKEQKKDHALEISFGIDDCLINGDSTPTHQDSDTDAVSQHVAKLWKGLRKLALAGSLSEDWSTGGITLSNMDLLSTKMGKYNLDPRTFAQVFWLLGTKGFNTLKALSDFKTADKAGSKFTLFNGVLQKYDGNDVLYSSLVRENLNASGVYDGTTTTKGNVIKVNPSEFIFGLRKKLQTIVIPDPENDRVIITSKVRIDFAPFEAPSSTISSVAIGINYDA